MFRKELGPEQSDHGIVVVKPLAGLETSMRTGLTSSRL